MQPSQLLPGKKGNKIKHERGRRFKGEKLGKAIDDILCRYML